MEEEGTVAAAGAAAGEAGAGAELAVRAGAGAVATEQHDGRARQVERAQVPSTVTGSGLPWSRAGAERGAQAVRSAHAGATAGTASNIECSSSTYASCRLPAQ